MGRKQVGCEASLRSPALNEPTSSGNEADGLFPAHRRRHRIASSALSQRLEGSTDPVLIVAPSGQSDSVSSWGHRVFRQSLTRRQEFKWTRLESRFLNLLPRERRASPIPTRSRCGGRRWPRHVAGLKG